MLVVMVFIIFCVAMLSMALGLLACGKPLEGGCGRDCNCRGRQ
jgi:hypothetical protein